MEDFRIIFEESPWWIVPCLLAAVAYAWLLYRKGGPWGEKMNRFLFGLRFFLVFLLGLLLLSPFIKQISTRTEAPVVVLAVDNSASLAAVTDSTGRQEWLQGLGQLSSRLEEQGYALELRTLAGQLSLDSLQDIRFDAQATDINQLLRSVANDYEGRNLAGMVLLSDGIYNQGLSPLYTPQSVPLAAIGVGDTLPKQDINLRALRFNKLVYQGNEFLLQAEIIHEGYGGRQTRVTVTEKGKELVSEIITLNSGAGINQLDFKLLAEPKGLRHLVVQVQPLDGEFTTDNNLRHAYIDVVDGQEKILIASPAPHPDIKTLRSAMEKNQNYEVTLYIPGLNEFKKDEYDLVILHSFPNRTRLSTSLSPEFERLLQSDVPRWYILGTQTHYPDFNRVNSIVQVETRGGTLDEVSAAYNESFSPFDLQEQHIGRLEQLPPVTVSFADYAMDGSVQVLLYQQVGSVETRKPLLVVSNRNGQKQAIFFGEGLWKWRLAEFADYQEVSATDEMISRVVQYLSAREDKRKFRVYPRSNEVTDNEPVVFETEIYNDVYDPIYNKEVSLIITDEAGAETQYTYLTSAVNSQYRVSGLSEGVYQYRAYTTADDGERLSAQGAFTVRALRLENLNLTADFGLMQTLAEESGGAFYPASQIDQLGNWWGERQAISRAYAQESFLPVIFKLWLIIPLLLLISIEWFIRKYSGSY